MKRGGTAVNSTRSRNRRLKGISLVLLILCVIASLAVLFERISIYSKATLQNTIPLTESTGTTKVVVVTQEAPKAMAAAAVPQVVSLSSPASYTHDDQKIWQGETDVDIFRITYDNDSGEMTVNGVSDNSDKLIAPGTSGIYQFALENTGDVTLDYTMDMQAWVTGTDLEIPVKARVWNYTGEYLLGNAAAKENVLSLNTVEDSGPLGAGRFAAYTLEWEWPFEEDNDAYDTLLGNLAAEDELALTIRINTTAVYNDDPQDEEAGLDSPQTGDPMPIGLIVCILCASLAIAAFSFLADHRRKHENEHA